MSVRIITDSSTDLTPDIKSLVEVIPLTVLFGTDEYADGVDIDHTTFYTRLINEKALPTTSQATPLAFAEKYAAAKEAGDEIVVITVSSALSGTYQSATIAAEDFDNVHIVDGRNVAIGTGILVNEAAMMAKAGRSAAEIVAHIETARDKVRLVAMVDTLEYLKRGGRVSRTVAFAGGLLNVKPIIGIKDGVIEMFGKARGTKAAFAALVQNAEELGGIDTSRPFITGYTGLDDSFVKRFMNENCDIFGCEPENIPMTVIGSVIGTHAGPGAVAMAFFAK